jgi:multiple sugar transport system substrate-binding protein
MQTAASLKGITWNHTRGYLPVVATAQRFCELHAGVSIEWEKRSLQQFADAPLKVLAERFDLMVIDHPSIGEAAHQGLLFRLDEHLPPQFLADQAANTVGGSHASYNYEGHQYALAIDAATPVAGWRPDLLAEPPKSWDDLLALARKGLVTVPAIPIDSLMNLFMLANALGAEPFTTEGAVEVPRGAEALEMLRELVQLSAPGSLERNPIKTWQLLAESESVAYCPFAYGYSNYSRDGYGAHRIQAGPLVSFRGALLRSTLGGAGIAVSANCKDVAQAVAYAQYTASAEVQRTTYTFSGGQPGHREAWVDAAVNELAHNFFSATLGTLDAAWVRPRFPGFIAFQDSASELTHQFLREGGSAAGVIEKINAVAGEYKA